MALNSTKVIQGNIGDIYDIIEFEKSNGKSGSVIDFNIASTDSRFDRENQEFKDVGTLWTTVKAWDKLAQNVKNCLKVGDPVLVFGREEMKPEYEKDDGTVIPARPILVATAIGPDLSRKPAVVNGESASNNSSKSTKSSKTSSSEGKMSKKSSKKKEEPKDDLDDDFDLDLDLDFDESDEPDF